MTRRILAGIILASLPGLALGAPPPAPHPPAAHPPAAHPPAPHPPVHVGPPPKLPGLPSVARVRVEVGKERLVVIHDVNLPKGDWTGGDVPLFSSFGAPAAPSAVDARLVAVPDGDISVDDAATGEPVALEKAPRRPPNAAMLLGRPQMAGVVARIKEAAFKRAVAASGMAVLRMRWVQPLPEKDPSGAREVLARLGVQGGAALTLLRVEVASAEEGVAIARADARLCGPDADPYPLAVSVLPRDSAARGPAPAGVVSPMFATRHPTDDLCVRFALR